MENQNKKPPPGCFQFDFSVAKCLFFLFLFFFTAQVPKEVDANLSSRLHNPELNPFIHSTFRNELYPSSLTSSGGAKLCAQCVIADFVFTFNLIIVFGCLCFGVFPFLSLQFRYVNESCEFIGGN